MANTTMAAKRSARRDDASSAKQTPSSEEVRSQIAQAAYYRALQRGFTPGFEVEDWIQAEAEVLKRAQARPASN